MKIKITIGGNDRTAIILPADSAGLAAELMSRAAIFERDGYYSTSGWKPRGSYRPSTPSVTPIRSLTKAW